MFESGTSSEELAWRSAQNAKLMVKILLYVLVCS